MAKGNHNPVTKFKKGSKVQLQPGLNTHRPLTVKLDMRRQHAVLTMPQDFIEEWGNQ